VELRRRHWAVALLVAALLQLALAALLQRPHSGQINGRPGGVEIQIGSSPKIAADRAGQKTAPAVATATPPPASIQTRAESPAVHEPTPVEATALPDKNEFKAVTLASPPPESAPTSDARTRLPAAVETSANPPQQKRQSAGTANIAAPAQSRIVKSKTDGKQSLQTAAPTTSNERDQAAGAEASGATGTGGDAHATATVSPDYYLKLAAWLERHKRYPRRAIQRRQQGVVRVSFKIDRKGNLLSRKIIGSSGYRLLDEAADSLLQRASPMPGIPDHSTAQVLELIVPIMYALR